MTIFNLKMFKTVSLALAFCIGSLALSSPVRAQDEFDKMFEEMMQEFFPRDLLNEIESIREKKEPTKGQSFYKTDPGFLAIKQRQIRSRRKDRVEKQHPSNLYPFRPLAAQYSKSVVAVYGADPKVRLSYATAVNSDGLLVTKASTLKELQEVNCVTSESKEFKAKVVKVDETNDLALLKTSAKLTAIEFETSPMDEGTILVTVDNSSQPVAMGTLAVKPRSIIGKNRGFLGVEPAPGNEGVLIRSVTERSAASRAGIQAGDLVTAINSVKTLGVADLVREIGSKKKGDSILLKILRSGKSMSIRATLDGRMLRGERAARFEMMQRLGAVLSQRRDEFPSVLEHDTPILPNDCGSPIVDLEGKVIGINIARAGRTSSYAIPIKLVEKLVRSYKS